MRAIALLPQIVEVIVTFGLTFTFTLVLDLGPFPAVRFSLFYKFVFCYLCYGLLPRRLALGAIKAICMHKAVATIRGGRGGESGSESESGCGIHSH